MKEELKLKISELKKDNIIDHAEKLFSELGIENTTIDVIAKSAGILYKKRNLSHLSPKKN